MAKIPPRNRNEPWSIAEIMVTGFKSLSDEQSIEIRPLTLLAGANSSGKSSMMQPGLLLKQTLEASYDPGALLLNGPNVKFTSAEQMLSRTSRRHSVDVFRVGMRLNTGESMEIGFRKEHKMTFRIEEMQVSRVSGTVNLWPEMTQAEIVKTGVTAGTDFSEESSALGYGEGKWKIVPERCFLEPTWIAEGPNGTSFFASEHFAGAWQGILTDVIHLPGLRGNPERTYPVTAVGHTYPGTFEKYTASVISEWVDSESKQIEALNGDLTQLQLTGGITAHRLNAVQIELHVGRLPDLPPSRPADRVNIADVGVGVSQTLPVLVALRAAKKGQLVYIEQPETHLHPRAQFGLAQILASAAVRGVRLVVETHSSLLLLGVQTLIAEGKLDREKVKLHWFKRERDGHTVVHSGELDEAGRFGDWPEDFDDVSLHAQKQYLDAADKHLFAK